MSKPKFIVAPIDVDFAGWSLVKAGEHNAWGVIEDNPHGMVLNLHYSLKSVADQKARELNGE